MTKTGSQIRAAWVACIGLAALSSAPSALADVTPDECVAADTAAQSDRRAEHFRAAREHLDLCSTPGCPNLVREDCSRRLNDLDAIAPSIVFAAKDAAGEDVLAVRVTMDGAPFATELSGVALPVDPGVHTFTFEVPGSSPVEKRLVVREGEKGRQERIVLASLNTPKGSTLVPVPPPAPPVNAGSWGTQKTVAVVAGAAGVVGVIVGGITGGLSFSAWSSSRSECGSGGCANRSAALTDHNNAVMDATVSDIGFIAGGVLVASGVVLYVTSPPSRPSSPPSGMLRVVPQLGVAGGGMSVDGRF